MQPAFQIRSYSFLNKAASGHYCPSIRTVALLLHAISILRPKCPDSGVWRLDGWTSFARLALSRIASGQNSHVIEMVAVVFPYLCFGKKSVYLSNTERSPDGIATSFGRIHLNAGFFSNFWRSSGHVAMTSELFEASIHLMGFQTVLPRRPDIYCWLMSI
jgi:hypothetical protein